MRRCWPGVAAVGMGLGLLAQAVVAAEAHQCPAEPSAKSEIGAIIYVPPEYDWGQEVRQGMCDAAREAKTAIRIVYHSFSLIDEMAAVRAFVDEGRAAIVIPAVRPYSSIFALREARAAGVELVCFNTCIEGPDAARTVSAFFQSDQEEMGYQTGVYLAQWLSERRQRGEIGRPRVAIVQCELFEACYARGQGFRAALADAGVEWTLSDSREGLDPQAAQQVVEQMLRADPAVNVVWADNGQNTLGAVAAVRSLGLEGRVFVFGTDMGLKAARMLLDPDDVLQSASNMLTYEMARRAVIEAARRVSGGEPLPSYLQILPSPLFTRRDLKPIEAFLERRAAADGEGEP